MMHYHFIGIGGTGLSAIARVLLERGDCISGSDMLLSPLAQELIDVGVRVIVGHKAENVQGADMVIRSSAVSDDNVEVVAARAANIPVLKRKDFLQQLTQNHQVLAVAGTHGKTTTTAMLAWVLNQLGADPSYIIGGVSKNLHSNAYAGKGSLFVIEADEYDSMFLGLQPDILVVTNLEHDHPDYYPSFVEYFKAFQDLIGCMKAGGKLLLYAGDQGAKKLGEWASDKCAVMLYGEEMHAAYRLADISHQKDCGVDFHAYLTSGNSDPIAVQLQIPGAHNALNALATLAVIDQMGYSIPQSVQALQNFNGTERRFDIKGEAQGVVVIDDYAHHPTEIRTTLSAARCRYPNRRIWVVWQPHTYSRTKVLFSEFARSFENCDYLIVSDIYRSREEKQEYSPQALVDAMQHTNVRFIAELADISAFLLDHLIEGDVLLVLSAGDADKISKDVLASLELRDAKRENTHG